MFQTAELGRTVSREDFKRRETSLRENLLALQQRVRANGRFPVLLDFAGVRGAGKGTSANLLNKWMDARWIVTQAYDNPSDEERERPYFWRFWRHMPPRGQIGIYLSARYSRPMMEFVYGQSQRDQFLHALDRINSFEQALADDGALQLKFWMHISRDVQEKRLKSIEKDPLRSWRMSPLDWQHWEMYDRFIEAAELIVTHTNTGHAPWHIVEGEDYHYRSLQVGEILETALERHLATAELRTRFQQELQSELADKPAQNGQAATGVPAETILDSLDMSLSLKKKAYRQQLTEQQARLAHLHQQMVRKGKSVILVFEGPDAAGKGGTIRQLTEAMDARYYDVYPFAAPTKLEHAHHYLWRFWNCIPRAGRMAIFDRSWYGRVLVERIEQFARQDEWRRAYAEINDFEEQLIESGIVLLKFWVHISKEEQLKRFKSREETPHKRWKLCDEDWRNREKWDDYALAAHEMIQQTSVSQSPWVLVENEDKLYGRIKVLKTLCDALEHALGEPPLEDPG